MRTAIRWPLVALILFVLVFTGILYVPGLNGPFVLDDAPNIGRAYIPDSGLAEMVYSVTHNGSGWLGRSVSMLSFVLTGIFYGLDPFGYKLHNLLLHLLNGVLLFKFLQLTLNVLDRNAPARRTLQVAGVTTALWLLHPLLVSTVLYAVQRMTQLAVFFSLLALICYLVVRRAEQANARIHVVAWILFPLCQLLAVLSKEIGALIPVYILAIELLGFRSSWAELKARKHVLVFLGLFVAGPLLLGGMFFLLKFDALTDYSTRTFTLADRLLTQVHALFYYIRMILLPRVRDMGLYHDDFPVVREIDALTAALILVLLALLASIWLLRKRAPVLAFGLAFFFISHLLESTILPLEMVFEHRNYLPVAGLLLPLIHAISSLPVLRPFQLLLAGFALIFSLQTWSRVQEWSSFGALSIVAVQDHPNSERAHSFLANYYYSQGNPNAALEQLAIAQNISPDDAGSSINSLVILCAADYWDPKLVARIESILSEHPISIYALNGFDALNAMLYRGRCTQQAAADIKHMLDTAMALPSNYTNSTTLGYLQRMQGMLYIQQRDYDAGVASLRAAYENTGFVSILVELFNRQLSLDRTEDARATLQFVEQINEQKLGIEQFAINSMRNKLEGAIARAAQRASERAAAASIPESLPVAAPATQAVP